jgi:hypothetical protein
LIAVGLYLVEHRGTNEGLEVVHVDERGQPLHHILMRPFLNRRSGRKLAGNLLQLARVLGDVLLLLLELRGIVLVQPSAERGRMVLVSCCKVGESSLVG